jgi:purine-binding chemotaxis protein CheW
MENRSSGKQRDIMTTSHSIELATFSIGEALFGIDILTVEEINKSQFVTYVPQAPDYVLGVMNLRGRIVTIIDLGQKLGLSPAVLSDASRNIIVHSHGESVGLFVDRVDDVVLLDWESVSPPPANVRGVQGKFLQGILKTERSLIAILSVDQVLDIEDL